MLLFLLKLFFHLILELLLFPFKFFGIYWVSFSFLNDDLLLLKCGLTFLNLFFNLLSENFFLFSWKFLDFLLFLLLHLFSSFLLHLLSDFELLLFLFKFNFLHFDQLLFLKFECLLNFMSFEFRLKLYFFFFWLFLFLLLFDLKLMFGCFLLDFLFDNNFLGLNLLLELLLFGFQKNLFFLDFFFLGLHLINVGKLIVIRIGINLIVIDFLLFFLLVFFQFLDLFFPLLKFGFELFFLVLNLFPCCFICFL